MDDVRVLFRELFGADWAPDQGKSGLLQLDRETVEIVLDPHNRRLKLLGLGIAHLDHPRVGLLVGEIQGEDLPFDKLVAYTPPGEEMPWICRGFLREGTIQGYCPDHVDAHLWALYGPGPRDQALRDADHDEIVMMAAAKPPQEPSLPAGYACRVAGESDAAVLADLLQDIFPEYPTPLDRAHVAAAIASGANRFRLVHDPSGTLAAAASAEIDPSRRSAELTDCATHPDHRGRGLMAYILRALEHDLVSELNIDDLYTLARADEPGMNCVFAKLGYAYTGRLVNNCRMPNGWESMNVWCRRGREHLPG